MSAPGCTNGQSLIISPNLEALLEHDARMRRMKSGSSVGNVEPVQSLPPPPRRRKPTSPKNEYRDERRAGGMTDASSLPTTPSSSTSAPNPYVNPSPSFESVSDEQPEEKREIRNEEVFIRVPPRSSSIPHSEEDTGWKQFKMLKNAIGMTLFLTLNSYVKCQVHTGRVVNCLVHTLQTSGNLNYVELRIVR